MLHAVRLLRVTDSTKIWRKFRVSGHLSSVARAFPTEIAIPSNQTVVKTLLRGYETTENFPSKKIDLLVLQQMARSMDIVSGYLEDLYEAQGDLQFWGNRLPSDRANQTARSAITGAFSKNEEAIADLLDFALKLRRDPLAQVPPPPSVEREPTDLDLVPPPRVITEIYEHIDFGGRREELRSSIPNLDNIGFNDRISSIKVHGDPGEYDVEFYEHINYEGARIAVKSPAEDRNLLDNAIGLISWSDQISSIRITKKA